MDHSEPYNEGFAAWGKGRKYDHNPYVTEVYLQEWNKGWLAARDAEDDRLDKLDAEHQHHREFVTKLLEKLTW